MDTTSIVWFRRNLRLEDNIPLYYALLNSQSIIPIFIFDTDILQEFPNKNDRRLTFIANSLYNMQLELKKLSRDLYIFHGRSIKLIPEIFRLTGATNIFADEDFEVSSIERDKSINSQINGALKLYCDHLLVHPKKILKQDLSPYKVFTPYMKAFNENLDHIPYYDISLSSQKLKVLQGKAIDLALKFQSPKDLLNQVGYNYRQENFWIPENANIKLENFINTKARGYAVSRDFLDQAGTSMISPYLRFGIISIRKCFKLGLRNKAGFWIRELIWREFYAMILFRFPLSTSENFNTTVKVSWLKDDAMLQKYIAGQTGFPIIDAAIMQLEELGWVHNRARMILASFFTKNMLFNWTIGEKHFAQKLMDYDLASNVGGWQWAASTGTDPQPYFRVFNPILQAKKFDPEAKYIKRYLPKLKDLPANVIHDPYKIPEALGYPTPMLDLNVTRKRAIEAFKSKENYLKVSH